MKNKELLPCPFCGKQPHLDRHDIFCDCGVKLAIPTFDESRRWGYPNYKEARQEMIDTWNTRTNTIPVGNGEDYEVTHNDR